LSGLFMTTLYISEFPDLAQGINRGGVNLVDLPPIAKQTVSLAGGTQASAPFSATTKVIRLMADSVCSIVTSHGRPPTGVTPSATTADMRLAANQEYYFRVQPGSVLAAIPNT
jgi:hypothetical protein